jgi:acetoin utilization protein AcuA
MMEVKAVEVCRSRRSSKVAHGIVASLIDFPEIEDRIAYMVGYSWTWDLDGTGMSGFDYRQMLIRLFEPFGFQEFETNEPNLCLKPENLFMGRIGANVPEKTQKDFKWLRFGISPS